MIDHSAVQQIDLSWVAPVLAALTGLIPATTGAIISYLVWRDNHRRQLEDDERHAHEHAAVADLQAAVQHVTKVATVTAAAVNALPGGSDGLTTNGAGEPAS